MTTALKGVIAFGGVGSAVGGGFLLNSFISKDNPKITLASKLVNDKFTLLNLDISRTEAEGSNWRKILTSYSSLIKTKPELKVGDLSLKENDEESINQLKKACSSLLKMEEGSSDFKKSYKLVSKWCVEPISVETLLSKRGTPYLDTTGSANKAEWTEIAKKYEADKNANRDTLITNLSWEDVTGGNYDSNITKIKSSCNGWKSKSSHEGEFEKFLEDSQRWCIVTQ